MNRFGERFKECRIAAGLSQSEAAKLAGISQQAISTYELGQREPLANAIISMARVYGVSIDYLLGVEEPTNGLIVQTIIESED